MRRAALVAALLLAACGTPVGEPVDQCDASWRDVESLIVTAEVADPRSVPIDCMRQIDEYRIQIGFTLPAGPSCYGIAGIGLVESADAVAVTVRIGVNEDPAAGACPTEPQLVTTEIDLQAPVAGRTLLDGSGS